jgi:hypothetical protein
MLSTQPDYILHIKSCIFINIKYYYENFLYFNILYMDMNWNPRRRNQVQKSLRDYMAPIIIIFFIVVLLYMFFSGWNSTSKIDTENKIWFEVSLGWTNSESYIVYPWDYKKKIEWSRV